VLAILANYREHMNNRSTEVIRQLNRLANDRSLPPLTRNKILDAIRHIKELQLKLMEVEGA
jgi:uncharacterized protein (UPF0147 family)